MSNFLHAEFDLDQTQSVQFTLHGTAANVMLMDDYNFERYKEGREYSHYGGFTTRSPISVRAPYSGHWHAIVDMGAKEGGEVNAAISVLGRTGHA